MDQPANTNYLSHAEPAFQWDRHFVTGLPTVDEQHHRLVDLINRFGDAVVNQQLSTADTDRILDELAAYAGYHFREEEKLMQDYALAPSFQDDHRARHQAFIEQVRLMTSEFREQKREVASELLDFLCHWLAYHILGHDQKMARQIRLIESGIKPEKAWQQVQLDVDSATAPLLNALNGLFDLLSEKNKKLIRMNAGLETKVRERTRELEEANRKLREISLTDELTALPNRRYAMEQLKAFWQEAVSKNQPLACMMIDADHFKEVNDQFGHDAGDTVLRALAQVLRDGARSDDFVARLGGDEFFIICPQTKAANAAVLAENLRSKVAAMHVSIEQQKAWDSSISIGIAEKSQDQSAVASVEDLIKAADDAVYAAKMAGKNRVHIAS